MKYLIVADSSADIKSSFENVRSVPLTIITDSEEYVDNEQLDVESMVKQLEEYKGRSSSSCPNSSDWLKAFGDAEYVFCITITSGLSGSYNSACIAKIDYEENHPERKVFVIDSLSTGPEMYLIVEKLRKLIGLGTNFDEICKQIMIYKENTGLVFMLESMKNLVNNGRVSPIVAKLAGILGIRVIGKASNEGTLEQLNKCRGEAKSIPAIFENMKSLGYNGGKVKIAHCLNPIGAEKLCKIIKSEYKNASVESYPCRGLCSFYAERGGLLVGFEKQVGINVETQQKSRIKFNKNK